jgi:tetratricopeptide (TPR) repeat protein
LLKLRSGSAAEFLNLVEEWLAAGEPRPARLLLEKAAFDFPENTEIAAKLAIATRRDPETRTRSARLFREAATIAGDHEPTPDFLLESAEAMIEQGQIPAAEDRLRSAIRSFPPEAPEDTAAALRRLASLWEAENRNKGAARALRQRADALAPLE